MLYVRPEDRMGMLQERGICLILDAFEASIIASKRQTGEMTGIGCGNASSCTLFPESAPSLYRFVDQIQSQYNVVTPTKRLLATLLDNVYERLQCVCISLQFLHVAHPVDGPVGQREV